MRTPFFNASMAPNGMMQVWSGLLLRVDNEAQLAAVLGHETGHYLQRHAVERLRDAKSRSAFGLFMAPLGLVGLGIQLANLAGGMGYSRDQEREADRIGLLLMHRAGYDPREAAVVWTNLITEVSAGAGDPAKRSPLFASHPASQERADTLASLAAAMPPGGEVGEAAFRQQMAPLQPLLIEDEIQRAQYGESLVLFTRLIARAPKRADLLAARGEVYRLRGAAGDSEAGLADLQQAIALDDVPPRAWRSLGYLQQKRQQAVEARGAFARYVELAPDAPDVDMIKTYLSEPQ
jgi:predicted Zn-dependent protease